MLGGRWLHSHPRRFKLGDGPLYFQWRFRVRGAIPPKSGLARRDRGILRAIERSLIGIALEARWRLEDDRADCHAFLLRRLLDGFYFTGVKPDPLALWTSVNEDLAVVFFE